MIIIDKIKYFRSLIKAKRVAKKIIVIESDDWGAERIPNIQTRDALASFGIGMTSNPYARLDTLERLDDLENLENILKNIYYFSGKKVKITTNFILANPDYDEIQAKEFTCYFYKTFIQTYQDRDGNSLVWEKIQYLMKEGYIHPQFHGREHINVQLWLEAIRNRHPAYLNAFKYGCYAIDLPNHDINKGNMLAAFEYHDPRQKKFVIESIEDGLYLFEKVFGFRSSTIVAPRHVWTTELEPIFHSFGVNHIQSAINQLHPFSNTYKKIDHYTGQYNHKTKVTYLMRNAYFEPAYSNSVDWVSKTMNKVNLAFTLHIPVILSIHRINFVGGLEIQNREQNLILFQKLLLKILHKYPDVEFLSSDELALLI